jgi:hypothetical protein
MEGLDKRKFFMTKSVTRIMRWVIVLLIIVFTVIWRHYSHYLPDFITRQRTEQFAKLSELFAKKSKESIDEMLVLHEKSKGMQGIDALTYLMTVSLDYGNWLDDNKAFINQHPILKETLIEQLKSAIKQIDRDFIQDLFEDYIKVLEDITEQKKSISKEFF